MDNNFNTLESYKKEIDELNRVMEANVKEIAKWADYHRAVNC